MPVGTTLAILGAAAIGGAATVSASNSAAKAAKTAAAQNAETIANTQTKNDALLSPYVATGVKATDTIDNFLGQNGSTAQDAAFQKWRDSTGYQFNLNQGLDSLNSNLALKSQLKSGSAMKAAIKYGESTANTYGQQYLSNLQTQQAIGANAAGANVSANSGIAGATVTNNNNLASSIANNTMTNANSLTNALGDAVSAYGRTTGQKTDSSYSPAKKQINAFAAYGTKL